MDADHYAHRSFELETFLASFPTVHFDDASAREYGKLRSHLKKAGCLIGPNDLLIASIALAHDFILVTHNYSEFCRVPGLQIEDWQQ